MGMGIQRERGKPMTQDQQTMLPFFEEHHVSLKRELHQWCRNNINDNGFDEEQLLESCRQIAEDLARAGWLRYLVVDKYGGHFPNLDLRSICLIREVLASYSGLADFVFAMQGLGSATISLFGDDAQKAKYLPRVRKGEAIAAFALTEEVSGSDVAQLRMTATRTDKGYVLNGRKTYISNAGVADFYVVFARTGDQPGAKGISAFIIDKGLEGLDDSATIRVNAPHPLGVLELESCNIAESCLIGELNFGFKQAMGVLDMFRTSVGAAALGLAKRGFDEAGKRAMSRFLFSQKLSDNPIIKSKLADMALQIEASTLLIYRSAWMYDTTDAAEPKMAAMAKLYATEAAQKVIDEAVQIFGGLGVTVGCPVELLYREVRSLRIYEGASEVQRLIIGRRVISELERTGN